MREKILKSIFIIGLMAIIMLILTTVSNAASLSISTSKSSVSPGESFTVTVTLNGGAGPVSASVTNGSGSGSNFLDNSSLSFTCTAGSSGTVTISASGTVGDYATETDVYVSNSKSVTIVVPQTTTIPSTTTTKPSTTTTTPAATVKKSSDAKLTAINVEGYTISPEFDPDVKEYTLSVPYEVTSLNVTATKSDSKARYQSSGDEELQVGPNEVLVNVTAEDGTKNAYTIIVTRAREELYIKSLVTTITDENGIITELPLNPIFSFDVFEYTLDDISYKIENINVEAIANLEGATIAVTGNENLQEGENVITVIARIPKENVVEGEETEEIKTYKITVNKEAEPVVIPPTMMGRIKTFWNNNSNKITSGVLLFCSVAFAGLTIYFAVDYKKYKTLISKIAELNRLNNQEIAIEKNAQAEENEEEKPEKKPGRHF